MVKAKTIGIIILVVIICLIFAGFLYAMNGVAKDKDKYQECSKLYPLNSCELYKCRATYTNLLPDAQFNYRNYEICKIILNNNMTFNESLPLLNTITYNDK